jgi:outer membrane murein-binding lipoprotein Lpp
MAPKSPALKTTNKYSQSAGDKLKDTDPGYGVKAPKVKSSAGNFEPAGKQKNFIPWAFRSDKKLGGGSHSGIKGAMGSKTRKSEHDAKGWAYDETISKASTEKPKVKAVKAIQGTQKVKDVAPKQSTKAPELVAKVSAPKKEVKQTRSQKIRAKGEAALAGGNKKKALRLRRRLDRVEARKAKKEKNVSSPAKKTYAAVAKDDARNARADGNTKAGRYEAKQAIKAASH